MTAVETSPEQVALFAPGHDPRQRRHAQPELVEDRDVASLHDVWAADSWALLVDAPIYGTAAYLALDEDDPLRLASAIRTAFTWVAAEQGLAAPASREHLDRLVGDELRAAAHAVAAAADWGAAAEDLDDGRRARARRADWYATARDPRPGDFPGRPPAPERAVAS